MRSFIKGFQHSSFVKQGSFEQYMAKKKKSHQTGWQYRWTGWVWTILVPE